MRQEMVRDLHIKGASEDASIGMIPQMTLLDTESVSMLFVLSAYSQAAPPKLKMGSLRSQRHSHPDRKGAAARATRTSC